MSASLKKIIRDEAGNRLEKCRNGISAEEVVEMLFTDCADSIAMMFQDPKFQRRAVMSIVERVLKEAESKATPPQMELAPLIMEVKESCSGLTRCISYLTDDGTARYVSWYHANEDQIERAEKHYESQSAALRTKAKGLRELKSKRQLLGVPPEVGLVEWKEAA